MRQDSARLAELRRQLILDTSPEKAFDDIARLLADSLDVPIAMVNFMDRDRDWFKARVGLALAQQPVDNSFCESFFESDTDVIVVADTLKSERFKAHPLVTGEPGVRFYAAARLVVNGQTLGTLCAYDVRPRQLSEAQIEQLQVLTRAVFNLLQDRFAKDAAGPELLHHQ